MLAWTSILFPKYEDWSWWVPRRFILRSARAKTDCNPHPGLSWTGASLAELRVWRNSSENRPIRHGSGNFNWGNCGIYEFAR
jgi:hypothetical protein